MKKLIILLCSLILPLMVFADRGEGAQILLRKKNNTGHIEYYIPADMPEVYYDEDNAAIIVVGDGFSSYYDVVIIRESLLQTVISTQISGYGDNIDVSTLPDDGYRIVITSSNNNVYEGYFLWEQE